MKRRGVDSVESWVVAVASSVVYLLAPWPMRLGGQLFVFMLDHFDTNRKDASFPFALAYLMRSISGPFAGYFGVKLGLQTVTIIGMLLCGMGVGLCYFAEDVIAVNICLGLIFGTGYGWATAVIPEILNQHFVKHRAKANGLAFGASSLGAFVTPPVLAFILTKYGLSGTFLLMSAILLHGLPFSMLMTKPRLDSANTKESIPYDAVNALSHSGKDSLKSDETERDSSTIDFHYENNCFINLEYANSGTGKQTKINRLSMQKLEYYNLELFFQKELRDQNRPPLMIGVPGKLDSPIESKTKIDTLEQTSRKRADSSVNVLLNPNFLLVTTVTGAHFYLQYMFWTIIVDIGRDKGSEPHQEVYLVMALALFDMLGRLSLGCVTDSGIMTSVNFCATCFACIGLLCLVMVWVSGFLTVLIATSLLGVIIGGNTTGLPGIVTEIFQKEKRSMAMASRLLMYAPMSFTMSPLIGYFRGTLGSYDGLLYVLMASCLFCVCLLLILSKLSKTRKKDETETNEFFH